MFKCNLSLEKDRLIAASQRNPLSDATNMNMQIADEIGSNYTTIDILFQKKFLYFLKALSALLLP